MSMIPSKLELLKIARELVINEYIDKRAQDHNKWVAEADVAWRTRGIKLPYPSFPIYPSEADIIARASALNDFLTKDEKKETVIEVPEVIPPAVPPVADIPPVDAVVTEPILPVDENFSKMIPPIMAKIEEFKSQWVKK